MVLNRLLKKEAPGEGSLGWGRLGLGGSAGYLAQPRVAVPKNDYFIQVLVNRHRIHACYSFFL